MASLVDLFRQIVEHGFNRGDLSIADEICSDALIEHEYLAPRARGADILKRQVTAARDGLAGMHRLTFPFFNIGDQIATTPIPENYFNSTGERVVISDKRIWAFKHNPYVVVLDELEAEQYPVLDLMPDCRLQEQARNYAELTNSITASSQAEYMCLNLGFKDVTLRHPRLYCYEDSRIVPDKVVVHTTGSDRTTRAQAPVRTARGEDALRIMSDNVIASILKNYADWQVIQVGGECDKPLGGHSIDLRGKTDYWETAREIASAARFIGVNSGPMHIANCYPRVDKRIVLMEFPKQTLLKYRPGDLRNWAFSWIDPASTFFNRFNFDVGLTYSHAKL